MVTKSTSCRYLHSRRKYGCTGVQKVAVLFISQRNGFILALNHGIFAGVPFLRYQPSTGRVLQDWRKRASGQAALGAQSR